MSAACSKNTGPRCANRSLGWKRNKAERGLSWKNATAAAASTSSCRARTMCSLTHTSLCIIHIQHTFISKVYALSALQRRLRRHSAIIDCCSAHSELFNTFFCYLFLERSLCVVSRLITHLIPSQCTNQSSSIIVGKDFIVKFCCKDSTQLF